MATSADETPEQHVELDSLGGMTRTTGRVKAIKERHWYAVHTYSGYENKVKKQLEARIATQHLQDRIFQILVPIEEVVEVKNGERRTVKRKRFPSYVYVDMIMDEDSWYCVKNTPGVTGFIGGTEPIAIQEHEIATILRDEKKAEEGKPSVVMPRFQPGQTVKIIDGPFADFVGQISEVHPERNKVTVLVSFFNRETGVDLDYLQVEKM
jgi:transcriptional antiterminator NusG